MGTITEEKNVQVRTLLEEFDFDCWLIAVRETLLGTDPIAPLLIDHEFTWPSFFFFHRDGSTKALVGHFDQENLHREGIFREVHTYTEGAQEKFRALVAGLDPRQIALNYAVDDPSADGLSHGMFLMISDFLTGTPYADRLSSAVPLCNALRGRKSATEIARLEKAAAIANDIWNTALKRIRAGLSEIEIADLFYTLMREHGVSPSFQTIVNAGSKSEPGHGLPGNAQLEPGDLLHVDFGVRYQGYCSDLQRLAYICKPGEDAIPPPVQKAFHCVRQIIEETREKVRPGDIGWEIDRAARQKLAADGYSEYQHALGHQLGRNVHDGGALLGPRWERYGNSPTIPLAEGNAFTIELEIIIDGVGCVGLEEDIVVEKDGGRFLCQPQTELSII
jgi:Xaa-Pro aminopeptidase